MTLDEALALGTGDYVTSPHMFTKRPIRVTQVWVNEKRTIVMARLNTVGGQQWLDLTAYDLPPKGMEFDRVMDEWVTHAEMKRRKADRKATA